MSDTTPPRGHANVDRAHAPPLATDAADQALQRGSASWPRRVVLLALGVALLPLCFGFVANVRPSSQSGDLGDYARLLLSWKPSLPFVPFLLSSIFCVTLAVVRPERFVHRTVIRWGIYTGIWLAVHFLCLLALSFGAQGAGVYLMFSFLLAPVGVATFVALPWLGRRFGGRLVEAVVLVVFWISILCPFPIIHVLLIVAAPTAMLVYAAVALRPEVRQPVERFQFSLAWLFGLVTWVAAYLGAWRWSILIMLEEYAKLPAK